MWVFFFSVLSQNHRLVKGGRVMSSTSLLKQCPLEHSGLCPDGYLQRRRLHNVSGQPDIKISLLSLNPVLMQCTRGKAVWSEAAEKKKKKDIYPSNEPKHCVHQSKTDTGFCQEKKNCHDRTRNRKVMVIEAVQVPVAWFLLCCSCKGSKGGRTAS